ncbi:mucin-17-like isoform X3 [Neodiprion fabricii]|uniref:mucin-17-like isoform X3 n=1 Tax=Neodiprion fabricii TaxID=2872261 RepID=UPI001ED93D36|nr:mucin-17-like isoform X3 [Neodiprion fabricii]
MSALSAGMSRPGEMILFLVIAFLTICCSRAAPVSEHDTTHIAEYGAESGCYYNFQRYQEGDRIVTNEPCLNCTCHNRMLMCYLRVCPFTKAIGQNCTVEKRPDQCCPIITCPEVPVQLLTSTSNSPAIIGSTEIGAHDNYGCRVDERFYADGAQLPVDPRNPCELCYCIRNRTTCVMQECTLRVAGCNPVYLPGVCCPVKYNCDYDEEQTTTLSPTTPGLIMTTTVAPGQSTPMCYRDGNTYNDGELIDSGRACQHCYCFRGDIVCAVQDCKIPMKIHGKHCTPQPAPEGKCCPTTYQCDGESSPTEVEEEPQLGVGLSIPDHPYKEKATESPIPGLGYVDEDNNQPQQMVDVFPGADNTIPEQAGENEAVTEGPIQQETVKADGILPHTVKPFEEIPTELPGGAKDETKPAEIPIGTSVVESESTPINSAEDLHPTDVALPELPAVIGEKQPVTTVDEEKEAPHGSIKHDDEVKPTVTADEKQTEVNVDEGKPISPIESTDKTVSEDAIKTTEDQSTDGIVSEDEIKTTDELPTKETILERPTPTEIMNNVQEANEGSTDEQILKEPTQSGIEQETVEGVTSEEQMPSKIPAISEPQEPVNPLPENDEIAVEESTALPTQGVKSDEDVTKEPAVTELMPTESAKTEDSSIVIFPSEVELTKPKPSEESIFPETSTLKPTESEVPEQPIKETATPVTSVEEISVLPESHENEPVETPVSPTVLPTVVSADEDKSTEESGSIEGHTIDHSDMAKEPTAGAVPTSEVPTGEAPTSEIQTGVIPTGKLPTGEVPTSEITIGQVPVSEVTIGEVSSPDGVTSEVPSQAEISETQTGGPVIDTEHTIEPIVTDEKQPEGPIAVENPSEPAAHDHEDSVDIPEQGPTGIPISDRVPVVKAEDESVVHELHATEVSDKIQHTHVPDSLITDKQDEIPATYIPPIGPTTESEITPGQEEVTTGVVEEIVSHEDQAPHISKDTVTPASSEEEHEPTPQEELEHEKSTVIGQLPTEATQTEILPVENVIDEQENGSKQIFDEPTESDVKASESPEVSTEVQEVELEGFVNTKPTESPVTTDSEQNHVPVEDENFPTETTAEIEKKPLEPTASIGEIAEEDQQTQEPVANGEYPAENVAEGKPLMVPTHGEKTPELSLPVENPTGASGDEQKPVTDSAVEEKPIKSSENESESTEVSIAEKELSNTPVPAEESLTTLIPEKRPNEPVIADEKQTATAIPQEQLTESSISSENPVEGGVTAEDKPTEVSISQEQETGTPISPEAPSEVNTAAEGKPNDVRITEEKPTEGSIIQEELTTISSIDQKPSQESVVEQELTEASISEGLSTQASFDAENPVEPSGTEEKLIDIPASEETPTKTPIVNDESNVTPISDEKPTETSITGEILTQTSVAEDEPLNADKKPNEASITENTLTDISKSQQEPTETSISGQESTVTSGINEKPTEISFVEQKVTDVSNSDGQSTEPSIIENEPTMVSIDGKKPIEVPGVGEEPNGVIIVEENPTESSTIHEKETSIPVDEESTESPVTEQKIFQASATQATPTESSVQEEKIPNVPAGIEISTEGSLTETKTPVVVVGGEKVTESSTEEEQDATASATEKNPTGVPETEQRVTDNSIIEENPTETPIAEHETTSGSIEEGEPSGTPIAEVESEAGSIIAVSQAELTTTKTAETTSTDHEPANPSVATEGPVDTSFIDQKPIESSTPTTERTETVIPEEEPSKSSDGENLHTESSVGAEKDAFETENKPTHATNVEEEQTNIPVSEEVVTDKNIIEVESTGATATEQKPTGTSLTEKIPTEISVTDETISDLPVTETKPSDASVAEEKQTNTPVSNITETEPAEGGPATTSESEGNLGVPSVIAENPTPVPVGEEKLTEPSIAAEKPTEGTAATVEVKESSIVEEKPIESIEIAGEPNVPSILEEKPTEISIADEKSTESSVSEDTLSEIPQIVETGPQSSVPEEQPTEVSTSDDEKILLGEVEPTMIAKPEEGSIEASAPKENPVAHSDTHIAEGEITEVPESQENPTEPSGIETVEGESAKPSIVEEKPVNPITSEETPSGESPSDEKPTEIFIIPEEPKKTVEEEKLPIEPSVGLQQPIEPSVEEQQPIGPSVGEQQPIELSVEEQEPTKSSVGEQQPIGPSVGEEQPIEPSVGEQQPIEPSVGEQQPIKPSVEEQQPIEPSVEEKQPIGPSVEEQQPIKPFVEEQELIEATPEEQQPSEPSKPVPSEIPSQLDKDQTATEKRPEVFSDNVPSSIPGEGNCLVDGQSFANNSRIPPANLCQTQCLCISSIVHCDLVECSPPPSHLSNCMPIHTNTDSCCPIYSCDSTPTVNLESDSQMADNHTPGYEEIHVPSTYDYSKESSTPIIEYPAEPSDKVTPDSEEHPTVAVDEGTTPSVESIADLDQKIVEPIEQEIPEPTVPVQEPSGASETNGIPEQPVTDRTEQNPKPEVVDQQTEEAIMPTEEQKPISEEKQKPESPIEPSEIPVKAVITSNEPNIIPATTVDETTSAQQPEGTPTSNKETSTVTDTNVTLIPLSEESPEVIPTSEEHPVETGTSGEEQTTDVTKQYKPAVEIETATDQQAVPASEDVGPEEHHEASEKPIDNETVVPVGVLQEGEQVDDISQPTEKEPAEPVAPVDESTGGSEEHFENTEHPEVSVTDDNEQTSGFTDSIGTSPVLPTDQSIVESTDELTTPIGQHPEKHVPQPQSKGEQEVPVDSSTIGSYPELEAPVSTGSSEDQSPSVPVPTDGINLSNNAESSKPTPAGQVEDEIEGSTVIPVKHIDSELPILSSNSEVTTGEILPTKTSEQGEAQTPVSGLQPQEAAAPTTQPTAEQELTVSSETTTSTAEKHDQVIVETEPSIMSSLPDTTKTTEPNENTGEQATEVNTHEAEPISHETSATPVIESGQSVDTVPELYDASEPTASTESTEGQVTEVKETTETGNPEVAESSEPTANTENEPTGVEEQTTRPISSEEDIKTTVPEESVTSEQGESSEPPVSADGERISVEIPAIGPAISKEGTKPTISEITDEDHKTPTLELTTEPASPETAETFAPTVNQEDETVAAEHSTTSPVLIENTEKPTSTVNIEGQTISDVEKPTGPVLLQPAKSSEAAENTEVEPDVEKKPISEIALPDQDVTTGEPEVGPVSTVSSVSEESETVTVKQPSLAEIPQSGAEAPPSTTSSEVQTLPMEDSESVSPDQGVTAVSGASQEEETTPAQLPAVETSSSGTKSPIPVENAEEQMIPVQELESKPDSPDYSEEPIATLQPEIVPASQEDTEELAPTEGIEKEIIPTDQTASEPTSPSEGEIPVPTVGEEAVSITVEGEATSVPLSDDQIKLAVTSATLDDHGISVEAANTASVESEESSTPTTNENGELAPEAGPTARPVIPEENPETPTSTRTEVKTPETISTDHAETPASTPSEDEKVIATELPQPGSSHSQEVPTTVAHDETRPQLPTVGTPEQTVTTETPTAGLFATDHIKTPESVSSEEGENVNAEESTTELSDQDNVKTSALTESSVDGNTPVEEATPGVTSIESLETPKPTQNSEEETVAAGHPTEESGLFENTEIPIPNTRPDQETAMNEEKIIEPPKSIEQSTSSNFTPEEPTVYPKEEVSTTQSIMEEVPTQTTISESVKPELVTIDEQVTQEQIPVNITPIEGQPEQKPVTPELEEAIKTSEPTLEPATDLSNEPASENPSVVEESLIEATKPALVEGESMESTAENTAEEGEKPISTASPIPEDQKQTENEQTKVPQKEHDTEHQVTEISAPAEPVPPVTPAEPTNEDQEHVQTPDQTQEVPEEPAVDNAEGQLTIESEDTPVPSVHDSIEETKPATKPGYFGRPITSTLAPQGSLAYPDQTVPVEDNNHFPINNGTYLNPESDDTGDSDDYEGDDLDIYGPGTCRYGGKVYVSAQQIPRDDPCDFCFCFRSDIICLQQSCPPPIPGCHEEPINGFCCPRYECPVSMATSLNLTTTTTTTTTTLPPHFLSHAYKGAARRSGCQIRGQAYRVGETIPSASGPCLQCTCGGDGNMKCEPRVCSPEPMLRQMIAAATAKRRR